MNWIYKKSLQPIVKRTEYECLKHGHPSTIIKISDDKYYLICGFCEKKVLIKRMNLGDIFIKGNMIDTICKG